ncbi:hypothetical protein AB0L41_24005 [Amycolatopsis mediterranei]|uniref:hypothetical protein n=1 Tax=Amycolatopsis mediterranei TaxID=33910 RepID=UPI00343E4E0B
MAQALTESLEGSTDPIAGGIGSSYQVAIGAVGRQRVQHPEHDLSSDIGDRGLPVTSST